MTRIKHYVIHIKTLYNPGIKLYDTHVALNDIDTKIQYDSNITQYDIDIIQ